MMDASTQPFDEEPVDAVPERAEASEPRIVALDEYGILDTPPEQGYDDIVHLARHICGTPIALVSFVTTDRQWFKARAGLDACQTPLSQSVCRLGLAQPGLLVIDDLTADPRTRDNTLVTADPHLRFYAGARLETPQGVGIGMLCVIDLQPRPGGLTPEQGDGLLALARQVMALMELRRALVSRDRADEKRRASDAQVVKLSASLERVAASARESSRTWDVSTDLLSVNSLSDGLFIAVNPAWTQTLGWDPDELVDRHYTELVHPDDLASSIAAFEQVRRNDPVLRFVNRFRCRNGDYRCLSWVSVPEDDRLYSSARDVTEEMAQAAALAERTAERDHLWETSPDLLVALDSDGVFRRANPAWTAILGYDEAQLIGERIEQFVHPDDLALTERALADVMNGPLPIIENRYRHRDGSYRWIEWVAAPRGGVVYATGRHVTDEKQRQAALEATQEALRQAQKMEAVGQLTGGLAHDFNNLLTGIAGSLELMQLRIGQGRLADVDRYMSAAQSSTRRAAALTHRLLAFSRRQTLAPKPTDVKQLVNGMDELIRRTVGPSIDLQTIDGPGPWTSLIDPSQLENAVLNLCINARDAMPHGGQISIESGNHRMTPATAARHGLEAGDYVCVRVSDTGTGMAPDVVARAFDPFFTTKPIGMGTGLGLSMVYGFAKQSGGAIDIHSELGTGTTICIFLPRHHGEAEAGEGAPRGRRRPACDRRRDRARRRRRADGADARRRSADRPRLHGHRGGGRRDGARDRALVDADRPARHRRRPARQHERTTARGRGACDATRTEGAVHHRLCRERGAERRAPRTGHARDHEAVRDGDARGAHPRADRGIAKRAPRRQRTRQRVGGGSCGAAARKRHDVSWSPHHRPIMRRKPASSRP